MNDNSKNKILSGFRDYLPKEMLFMNSLTEKIKENYESFGFAPLDTPALERKDVLLDGEDFNKSIFSAKVIKGREDKNQDIETGEESMLRFDLTMPLSRVVSSYDLLKPWKRYQMGKVWRGERPQKGRFREFRQFDIDIVGSGSVLSDLEVLLVAYTTLEKIEINNFLIRINNRKILSGLAEVLQIKDTLEFFRILDKVDDWGAKKVIEQIKYQEGGLTSFLVLEQFLNLNNKSNKEIIESLREILKSSSVAEEGIANLESVLALLEKSVYNIDMKRVKIDLAIARGLDYYTGMVFEVALLDGEVGTIFAGGRYDKLLSRFTNSNTPAIGASIGIDRLFEYLLEKNKDKIKETSTEVLVTIFDESLKAESLKVADSLRMAGIKTEIYLGEELILKKQIIYGVKRGIKYLVIIGNDEIKANKICLKNTLENTQITISLEEAISIIMQQK